jgi:hypothetical protein
LKTKKSIAGKLRWFYVQFRSEKRKRLVFNIFATIRTINYGLQYVIISGLSLLLFYYYLHEWWHVLKFHQAVDLWFSSNFEYLGTNVEHIIIIAAIITLTGFTLWILRGVVYGVKLLVINAYYWFYARISHDF